MTEMMSIREAYGQALLDLGKENPDIVVLDSDVSNSTRTIYFGQEFPARFFNFGIQEANMMDAAAGLASVGLVPVVNTFSFLATLRAAEQIRTSIAYNNLNVKIMGAYGGLSDSYDGASHQSVFDLAVMRSMPHVAVVAVSDGIETKKAMIEILSRPGPVYMRLCRNEVPVFFDEDYKFVLGRSNRLREGSDCTLAVTGILLDRTLKAADQLAEQGIQCRVLQFPTLKPIDDEAIARAAEETGAIVTVEEHSVIGGLGSAVAEVLGTSIPAPLERVGIPDTFAESGDYNDLLDKYGMSTHHIVDAAVKVQKRKSR
jgi:transketolase